MASPYSIPTTIDSVVLATSLADYRSTMADNVYQSNAVLQMLSAAKENVDGGNSIVQPVMVTKQDDGGFYLGADVLNNTQKNFANQVEFLWQNAYEPIQLTRDEERQNSGSEHKILSLVGAKTMSAQKAIADRLEQALSAPLAGANNLIDLQTICDTGTLGTLSGSTTTAWQATKTTSGAFATQGLTDMTTSTYLVSASATVDNPTHYLTTKTIFQKFEQTRLPLERIANGTTSANAGFVNLSFKGKPVIYGNYVASGIMLGLNMNYIHFSVDSMTDLITTDFLTPVNQTVRVAYILWRGQLWTDNRRRQFQLNSIT
tara:strand:+ start:326 stop:1276 length:951 start_codon:yes stop_codon:yes gene_type:complete